MQRYRILLANEDDAHDMTIVLNDSWNYAYKGIIPDEVIFEQNATRYHRLYQTLEDDNDSYYIVRDKSTPVGVFCIGPSTDKDTNRHTYEVVVMYIHPLYMRQGIGTMLMDYIVTKAKKLRMKTIKVWVLSKNLNAIEFYKKNGFVADGKTKYRNYGNELKLQRMERLI